MTEQSPAISAETKDRIISTANALKLELGKLPSVDQVRRAARVDMNAASQVMREWRQNLLAQSSPVVVAIPEQVQQAATVAIAAIWTQAQELANENLRNAQGAWEAERSELDAIRVELSQAYETQATELDLVKNELDRAHEIAEKQDQKIEKLSGEATDAKLVAGRLEIRVEDQDRLIASLKEELDKARQQVTAAEIKAARLEGSLESVTVQNKALLDAIGKPKK